MQKASEDSPGKTHNIGIVMRRIARDSRTDAKNDERDTILAMGRKIRVQ